MPFASSHFDHQNMDKMVELRKQQEKTSTSMQQILQPGKDKEFQMPTFTQRPKREQIGSSKRTKSL